jgi:hypothetical protein
MRMKIIFCLTPILLILLYRNASAQQNLNQQTGQISPWEIGFSAGIASFITSVDPQSEAGNRMINYWSRDIKPGFGLSVVRNLSPALGIEMNLLNTSLTGTWNDETPPLYIPSGHSTPLIFNSTVSQLNLLMTFNINQLMLPGDNEDTWHLFLKTGAGIAHIKDNKNFYPGSSPYIKMSVVGDIGLSVSLNRRTKLMAGTSFRSVLTDNLDGMHVYTVNSTGKNVLSTKVFEIYNYNYLQISYSLGKFRRPPVRGIFRDEKGRFRTERRH